MATQELPEGTVTVLFTDVVGSTELTNRLGDDAAREILGACDELVRQQVRRHRGQEVKGTGDGLMVAFQSARRAIACAVDIQRAVAARCRREPERAVGVRIGLNTGEVIREEADLFGATVNAAERIAGHAEAGRILVSDTVKALLGAAATVDLEDRGEIELRGFPEPWHLHAVRWEEDAIGLVLAERTPFVGREEERAQLRRLLDQAARGEGALVMIGGEAGVGKTRLAQELATEARGRGFSEWTGHCYEMEGAPPYIPFVEILEGAARVVPREAFREALGDAAPEVAKLMPELRRMFPDIGSPLEMPPENERRYLFNCMQEFIERASRGQSLFLTLEDLHWGDDSTLLLLQHIAQRVGEMPVLIVGTYRDVELDVARPLARALQEVTRQRLAHDLILRRLPEGDVTLMLRGLSSQEPPAALVQEVYRETEGNPFFVEEVFKHLAEEGRLFDEGGRWRSDLSIGELDVPRGVRLVIGQRLERLSEECRQALTGAAIIGRGFSYELLEGLGETDGDALLDAVDEAERARLIASTSEGPTQTSGRPAEARFTFAHEQIRQTLVSSVSLPRRQRLHLRVAEAMERVYAAAPEEHASDLAHHLYHAGTAADPSKTAHYLTLAGDGAIEAAAFEEALRHYESAVSLQPQHDTKAQADLLYKRGTALRSLGRWEEALTDWRNALDAYEELADSEAVGRVCWDICHHMDWQARWLEMPEFASRGLDATAEQTSAVRSRLLALHGRTLSWAGDYYAGVALITRGLAMAHELGDERLLGEVLLEKSLHHMGYGQVRDWAEAGLRSIELLRPSGPLWELTNVLWVTQMALLALGRLDEVAEIGGDLEPLASRLGHAGALAASGLHRIFLELMRTGDVERFEESAKAHLAFCRSAEVLPFIPGSYSNVGYALFWRGYWIDAHENFQQAVNLELPGILADGQVGNLFVSKSYLGERDSAFALLEQTQSSLPHPGQANMIGTWWVLMGAAEGLAILGERDQAAELYPLLVEAIDSGAVLWFYSPLVHYVAGIAAACGAQWDKAEEHYQTALRQAHELPHKIQQPEVRRWYARMLTDRDGPGDRDKARQLLTEAVAMYRDIGMPKHVEMAEKMVGEV